MKQNRWFQKAALQWTLSHVPGGESLNYRLQRQSSDTVRAARRSRIEPLVTHIWSLNNYRTIEGATVIELGTGWDLICSIIFSALGARHITACDHVPHARFEAVKQVVEAMTLEGDRIEVITGIDRAALDRRLAAMNACLTLDELLRCANITYKAPSRIDELPVADGSVDIVFTYAVLAHPPAQRIEALARECSRVLAPDGIISHYIGMQDPFADLHRPFNNVYFLRHSDRFWQFFVNNAINSNNRLRAIEHLAILRQVGARIVLAEGNINRADVEQVKTMTVAPRFTGMTPEDLAICQLAVVARCDDSAEVLITLTWRDQA